MANNVELLKQYKELLDEGILTQEEFEEKRSALLSEMQRSMNTETSSQNANNAVVEQAFTQNTASTGAGESTFGWAVLGFFIPIVGLILFLVWNNSESKAKGNSAGKGALVGVIVGVIGWVVLMMLAQM